MGKDGTVIAVEGYMDVIALAQAGFENAVAPLGTALTENQLELLWRMAPRAGAVLRRRPGRAEGGMAGRRHGAAGGPAGRTARFALLPEGKDPDDLVKADGPDAFRAVLAEARPLADLLWMRETSGGVFDTPERRAELEKTLRELTGRIRDESVRYPLPAGDARAGADLLRRAARARPAAARTTGTRRTAAQGGQFAKAARGGPHRGLRKPRPLGAWSSAPAGCMPLREAAIIVALVNHPALIDENFDACRIPRSRHPDLRRLHAAILDAMAHDMANDRDAVIAAIERAGCGEIWERAVALIHRARQWPALEDAALDDARDAFAQALHLHRSARTLHKELKAAEMALATDPTDENYRHLRRNSGAVPRCAGDGSADRRVRHVRPGGPIGREMIAHRLQLIRFFNANHARGA